MKVILVVNLLHIIVKPGQDCRILRVCYGSLYIGRREMDGQSVASAESICVINE